MLDAGVDVLDADEELVIGPAGAAVVFIKSADDDVTAGAVTTKVFANGRDPPIVATFPSISEARSLLFKSAAINDV